MADIKLINQDCMEYMATLPDKAFELAIVDPIYGDLVTRGGYSKGGGGHKAPPKNYKCDVWNMPKTSREYFIELFRVSENQIIFGGNYFQEEISKNSSCWIVWDKNNTGHYADAELAWTSLDTAVRIFRYTWNGMIQQNMKQKEHRIHTMQKPVALYQWLLKNYAKQGDKILDTHLGSGSSAIAADIMGFDFVGLEIDKDYFEAALDRFNRHKQQLVLGF